MNTEAQHSEGLLTYMRGAAWPYPHQLVMQDGRNLVSAEPYSWSHTEHSPAEVDKDSPANAQQSIDIKRLAACWNYCAGIDTATLLRAEEKKATAAQSESLLLLDRLTESCINAEHGRTRVDAELAEAIDLLRQLTEPDRNDQHKLAHYAALALVAKHVKQVSHVR